MSALQVITLPALSDNYVYLLHDPETGTTGVVDPPEAPSILDELSRRGWSLDRILITHHHPDHVAAVPGLKAKTGAHVIGPAGEADKIQGLDETVSEGDRVKLGSAEAVVLETPGHTAGHISYWFEGAKALFCADVLFAMGCGRLFEGTPEMMWSSFQKFADMPDDTRVYCGHEYTLSNARFAVTVDPQNEALRTRLAEVEALREKNEPTIPTTLGRERATNPFVRADDPGIRAHLGMENAPAAEVFGEIRRRKDNA